MRKDLYHNQVAKIGERKLMNCGEIAQIVKYNNTKNIIIKFEDTGEEVNCWYGDFKKGTIKSNFSPSVFNKGIIGLESTVDKNGKQLTSYYCWVNMLERCYSTDIHEKQPSYKGCTVCDEWLHYNNFKKWYDENYYEINNERTTLDKDILYKNNKVYSPQNCIFVPEHINTLITKRKAERGKYPIGVDYINQKYRARCNEKGKSVYLGSFNSPIKAFNTYKNFKENLIKQTADEYKNKIPQKLYDAMYKYQVDIND